MVLMLDGIKNLVSKFIRRPQPNPREEERLPPVALSRRIIAVCNQKGGCGKTTTAINLGACLAESNYRVLLIDFDPQSQASLGMGVEVDEGNKSIYGVLCNHGEVTLEDIIQPTRIAGFEIAPANSLLSGAQVELVNVRGRETILKSAVQKINRHYHYILIDCCPGLNLLTLNALTVARSVLIPIQTHYYSLEGMKELFKTVDIVKERMNPHLEILGILPTLFDKRIKVNREILFQIREYFKDLVFETTIRSNVKLTEAPFHGLPITRYERNSSGAEDYSNLAREVIRLTQEKGEIEEENQPG